MAGIMQSYDAPLGLSSGSLLIMKPIDLKTYWLWKFWSGTQTNAHIPYFPKEKLGVKF
jgi:hypothetical protein